MSNKQYEFTYKAVKNKELGELLFVQLQDKTEVIGGKHGWIIKFPKKKFVSIFQKQINDKKEKFIQIEFSLIELEAILEGFAKGREYLEKKEKQ